MRKLAWFLSALLFCFCLIAATPPQNEASESSLGTAAQGVNGPCRDGLYLGTLAASRGDAYHAPVGRWAGNADRSAFAAGYRRGYGHVRKNSEPHVSSIGLEDR